MGWGLLAALLVARAAAAEDADTPSDDSSAEATDGSDTAPAKDDSDKNASETEGPGDSAKDDSAGDDSDQSDTARASASLDVSAALPALESKPFARLWVGVAGSLDLAFLGSGSDVCVLGPNAKPWHMPGVYCTDSNGSDFPSRKTPDQNAALVPGQAGTLDGGLSIGDVRLLVAADYAVTGSILVGVRLGYVFNTYPGDSAVSGRPAFLRNLHLEARGTYVFGRDPLTRVAFAPIVFVGAGVGTTDGHSRTSVSLAGVRGHTPVTAWQIGGPALAVLGGGARYGFSARAAFTAAWKVGLAFGYANPLFTMGPEVGFQYGF